MAEEKILIIEDDPDILELVQYHLERNGFDVETALDGESGLKKALSIKPSLIVLDLMLPGIDGLTVCQNIRKDPNVGSVSIIILTAKGEESDVIVGLELGADDYVTKPFSPKELVARVRANLRSVKVRDDFDTDVIKHGPIEVRHTAREVLVDGTSLSLTHAEYNLLLALLRRPGHVITRSKLLEVISGRDTYVIDRNVDVHVRAVRKKLGEHADLIVTVRSVGYKCRAV